MLASVADLLDQSVQRPPPQQARLRTSGVCGCEKEFSQKVPLFCKTQTRSAKLFCRRAIGFVATGVESRKKAATSSSDTGQPPHTNLVAPLMRLWAGWCGSMPTSQSAPGQEFVRLD
jgi:hypothetical protein